MSASGPLFDRCAACRLASAAPPPAPPSPSVRFDMAGLVIGLANDDPEWLARARARFAAFLTPQPADLCITFLAMPAGVLEHSDEAGLQPHGDELHMTARPFAASVSADRTRARVWGPPAQTFPVDVLLRDLLPDLLPDGALFHGCGLTDGERGFLCCGSSGSGKSTLASLFPANALSDELVAVRVKAGAPHLLAVPFWNARPGAARLSAVHMIRHGNEQFRRRLHPAEAFRELKRHVLWPVHSPTGMRRTFEAIIAITATLPCFDLSFAPRADVWPVLTGQA